MDGDADSHGPGIRAGERMRFVGRGGLMGDEMTVFGPMPDLKARLLMGPDEVAPYLREPMCDYPDDGEVAVTWCRGDVEMVSADPVELLSGDLEEALAYLTHEAVHCAYRHFSTIGEDTPGEEEVAYHVASASHALFSDLFKWLGSA